MTDDEFLSKAIEFISSKAQISPDKIKADTHLVESGLVDSLMLTELILYVEDALDCTIEVDSFRLASFESINSIYAAYGH